MVGEQQRDVIVVIWSTGNLEHNVHEREESSLSQLQALGATLQLVEVLARQELDLVDTRFQISPGLTNANFATLSCQ